MMAHSSFLCIRQLQIARSDDTTVSAVLTSSNARHDVLGYMDPGTMLLFAASGDLFPWVAMDVCNFLADPASFQAAATQFGGHLWCFYTNVVVYIRRGTVSLLGIGVRLCQLLGDQVHWSKAPSMFSVLPCGSGGSCTDAWLLWSVHPITPVPLPP